ncbi:hypothetical protein AB0F42_24685 [Streptomyces buecherae]|uniref:MinD/ParA family ATP-binding protein n=1 Tax=Streptomyces buecherae TaxID=2763006 RepID=UPI0033DC0A68
MRRLIVFGAVSGAPGVTTTALAVASAWPPEADEGVRPVVVEADPSGGDLLIRFGLPSSPSLLDVAAASRQPHPGSLLGAASELPMGVRAVAAVPGRGPCREAVRLLADPAGHRVLLGDERDRGSTLLDVGRLTEDVQPLLDAADHVVLVARGGAAPLTHVAAYATDIDKHVERLTLAIVGPCPYTAEDVTQSLGIEAVAFLPWDAKWAATVGAPRCVARRPARFGRRPLLGAARALARRVTGTRAYGVGTGNGNGGAASRRRLVQVGGSRRSSLAQVSRGGEARP